MTYVAYTLCDNGFRFFADISGVCISYDPKLIKSVIAERGQIIKTHQEHTTAMEEQLRGEQVPEGLPPLIDMIMKHNKRVIQTQVVEHKRTGAAEATINEALVRDIMYFEDIKDAIAYSEGAQA